MAKVVLEGELVCVERHHNEAFIFRVLELGGEPLPGLAGALKIVPNKGYSPDTAYGRCRITIEQIDE